MRLVEHTMQCTGIFHNGLRYFMQDNYNFTVICFLWNNQIRDHLVFSLACTMQLSQLEYRAVVSGELPKLLDRQDCNTIPLLFILQNPGKTAILRVLPTMAHLSMIC